MKLRSSTSEKYMDKRAVGRLNFSRRGPGLASKDPKGKDGSIKCCNRIGCCTRFYIPEIAETRNREKAKYPRPSSGSTTVNTFSGSSFDSISNRKLRQDRLNGAVIQKITSVESSSGSSFGPTAINTSVDSSSGSSFASIYHRTLRQDQLNRAMIPKISSVEKNSRWRENKDSETNKRQGRAELRGTTDVGSSKSCHGLSENVTKKLENNHTDSSSRTRAQIDRRSVLSNQDTSLSSSSIRRLVASRSTSQANDQSSGRKVDSVRKRPSNAVSSLTSNRNVSPRTASPNEAYSGSRYRGLSASSVSPSRSFATPQASTNARNWPTSRAGEVTIKTQPPPIQGTRVRPSTQGNGDSLPRMHLSTSDRVPKSSTRSSRNEGPSVLRGRSNCVNSEEISQFELGTQQSAEQNEEFELGTQLSVEQNEERRTSRGGLDFYDQHIGMILDIDDMTYFYDQHIGMRLDIDDMTYEELLALEEKMGTVSTALSEETMSVCVQRSIYAPATWFTGFRDDDTLCSICQEEYVAGDEVGKLTKCNHQYHVACIHHWLSQKNWCPVCKTPASSS